MMAIVNIRQIMPTRITTAFTWRSFAPVMGLFDVFQGSFVVSKLALIAYFVKGGIMGMYEVNFLRR
ncbi:MAG: hypothetical protein AAB568_01895 [Patescibacteria group bacterium]